jgi:serine/threonine-protein kinase RsbT
MSNLRDESRSVLEGFFSAPIAKAIVGAAAKTAARAGIEADSTWSAAFEREIARLLCVYLPDIERRRACIAKLAAAAPPIAQTPVPAAAYSRPPSGAYLRPARTASSVSVRPATLGTASTSVVVRDQSDIPNACEVVRDLGKKLGFSRVDQTKMATAVSELARNMLQYAGGGTIRFAEVLAPRRGLEAFFEDHGPGIIGLDDMLEAGSMGLGLRGSKGIADEFLIDTQPGDGTRITMRKYVA